MAPGRKPSCIMCQPGGTPNGGAAAATPVLPAMPAATMARAANLVATPHDAFPKCATLCSSTLQLGKGKAFEHLAS
jgi:hypothetical protein